MIAIPAMDIIDGSCVRLKMGDYAQKRVYHDDPVEVAKRCSDFGLKRLHLVDLDGARAGHVVNLRVMENIARETDLVIDVGGGLKTEADMESVFNAGAAMATVGSIAAQNRELTLTMLETWGSDRLILGADCRDGLIAVGGWSTVTDLDVDEFVLSYLTAGFISVVSTDIARDGMMNGPSLELYRRLLERVAASKLTMSLIASGGVRSIADLDDLESVGVSGAIIGKALYEGAMTEKALAEWQNAREE